MTDHSDQLVDHRHAARGYRLLNSSPPPTPTKFINYVRGSYAKFFISNPRPITTILTNNNHFAEKRRVPSCMLFSREAAATMLSTLAPAREAANELKPAVTMSIWCTCYSITIIIFRVSGRWLRTKTVFVEDTIMALSILILVARMILVSLILYDGTNNVELSLFMDEAEISRREVGSQLVLVTRMLYAM